VLRQALTGIVNCSAGDGIAGILDRLDTEEGRIRPLTDINRLPWSVR
jgi:hypothetical protein